MKRQPFSPHHVDILSHGPRTFRSISLVWLAAWAETDSDVASYELTGPKLSYSNNGKAAETMIPMTVLSAVGERSYWDAVDDRKGLTFSKSLSVKRAYAELEEVPYRLFDSTFRKENYLEHKNRLFAHSLLCHFRWLDTKALQVDLLMALEGAARTSPELQSALNCSPTYLRVAALRLRKAGLVQLRLDCEYLHGPLTIAASTHVAQQ